MAVEPWAATYFTKKEAPAVGDAVYSYSTTSKTYEESGSIIIVGDRYICFNDPNWTYSGENYQYERTESSDIIGNEESITVTSNSQDITLRRFSALDEVGYSQPRRKKAKRVFTFIGGERKEIKQMYRLNKGVKEILFDSVFYDLLITTSGTSEIRFREGKYYVQTRGCGGAGGLGSGGAGGNGYYSSASFTITDEKVGKCFLGEPGVTSSSIAHYNGGAGGSGQSNGSNGGGGGQAAYVFIPGVTPIIAQGGGGGGGSGGDGLGGRYAPGAGGGGGGGFWLYTYDITENQIVVTNCAGKAGGAQGGVEATGHPGVSGYTHEEFNWPSASAGNGGSGYHGGGGSAGTGYGASGGGGGGGKSNDGSGYKRRGGGGGGGAPGSDSAHGGLGGLSLDDWRAGSGSNYSTTPNNVTDWYGNDTTYGKGGEPGKVGNVGYIRITYVKIQDLDTLDKMNSKTYDYGTITESVTETKDLRSMTDVDTIATS